MSAWATPGNAGRAGSPRGVEARATRREQRLLAPLVALLLLVLPACGGGDGGDRVSREAAAALTGGDPERGKLAIRRYGCGSCHTIAGVPGANGLVGPPLTGVAGRLYIGGVLPNSPENLIRWIQDPQAMAGRTAMPDLGVTEEDARDIAGYLYTLR